MDSLWTPLTCFAAIAVIFTIGDLISKFCKGIFSGLIISTLIFMVGFWTGILPADIAARTGITNFMNEMGTAIVVTNLGTMINLENMAREWKTVIVSISGFIGIFIVCFTIGTFLFGREYALAAAPPISGGSVAGVLVQAAANEAGSPEIAGFAMLVLAMQKFFGMPVCTLCLRKEMNNHLIKGDFDEDGRVYMGERDFHFPQMRLIPKIPQKFMSNSMVFAMLAVVASIAYFVGNATMIPGSNPKNYYLNPTIAYLVFGIIACRIGLLPEYATRKSQSAGVFSFGLMCLIPGSLAKISPQLLLEMLPKIIGLLGMSTIAICAVSALFGKLLGYSPYLSMACGCTCMMGYPSTEIIVDEIIDNMDFSNDAQRERARSYLLPKTIVAGFATVTIASVAFAGIVAPLIFK